jgi:hypothetical protein
VLLPGEEEGAGGINMKRGEERGGGGGNGEEKRPGWESEGPGRALNSVLRDQLSRAGLRSSI